MIRLLATVGVALGVLLAGALAGGLTEHATGDQDKGTAAFLFVYTTLATAAVVAFA